jgi:hypothetical protein
VAVLSGKDGSLKFDGTAIARVRSWSLQANVDTLETTNLGQIAREYGPGLKSASGNASIFYHDDNTSLQSVLDNCLTTGNPTIGAFELNYGTKSVKFNGYVNSVAFGCTTGEVMSAEVSFTMSGDYTSLAL